MSRDRNEKAGIWQQKKYTVLEDGTVRLWEPVAYVQIEFLVAFLKTQDTSNLNSINYR